MRRGKEWKVMRRGKGEGNEDERTGGEERIRKGKEGKEIEREEREGRERM